MNNLVTIDSIKDSLPKNLKCTITQDLVDKLNNINDPEICKTIKDNFITFNSILTEGKYKVENYIDAITYVTYKMMNYTNRDAYIKTFPKRYSDLIAKGATIKEIDSYVAMYSKGKLVTSLLERCYIPSWILNQDIYQKAINTQAELLQSRNEKVRFMAADSLMRNLAKPEIKDNPINLNINTNNNQLEELKETIAKFAQMQRDSIIQGTSVKEIAESKIIEVTPDE